MPHITNTMHRQCQFQRLRKSRKFSNLRAQTAADQQPNRKDLQTIVRWTAFSVILKAEGRRIPDSVGCGTLPLRSKVTEKSKPDRARG